ncbi:hypothetical protein FA95DRAFT_1289121 [Auriscalpium vulgare]|uniref:Uncharacterized protein n=1 Tax=Auriscalpium vulgare TaxID=40419 RepID=A0ACB8RSH6_9AGAM|nr:hypothetical protein FA95DRAFT_1289121 [Auriscalpium vulgare]
MRLQRPVPRVDRRVSARRRWRPSYSHTPCRGAPFCLERAQLGADEMPLRALRAPILAAWRRRASWIAPSSKLSCTCPCAAPDLSGPCVPAYLPPRSHADYDAPADALGPLPRAACRSPQRTADNTRWPTAHKARRSGAGCERCSGVSQRLGWPAFVWKLGVPKDEVPVRPLPRQGARRRQRKYQGETALDRATSRGGLCGV